MKVWNASQLHPTAKVVSVKDVNKKLILPNGYTEAGYGDALRNPKGKTIAVFAGSRLYTGNTEEPTSEEDAIAVGLWLMAKKRGSK